MNSSNTAQAFPEISEDVFRHVVEQSAIAISVTDANARILYVNPVFCTITGYALEEVLGCNQSLLSYKSTPKEVYQEMWGELTTGRAWHGRLLNRRRDGSPYVADLTVTPVRTTTITGQPVLRYLGMHWDATDSHRMERQLQNQRQLVESVVETAPTAVALLDGEGHVVLDNPAYRRIGQDLSLVDPARAVMGSLRESMGGNFDQAVAARRPIVNHELRFDHAERETRWFSCSLSWVEEQSSTADAFYDAENKVYLLLVMNDITVAKRQQETARLAAMRAVLSEGELSQSLREALSGAIFQLQGPVNLISAAANMQRRRAGAGADKDPLVQALAEAREAGETAIATLQSALPAEPLEATGPVNLNEVVRDVLMLETQDFLAAGVTVDWTPARTLPSVSGEATALRNLFRQLVSNAIEAMNRRGWKERSLSVITSVRGGQVEVELTDTGPGIPEELRLKIFEPFFSTKKPGQGGARGVGLALAQEIVRRHRGVLEVDPHYHGGCRLRVSLPDMRSESARDGGIA